MGNGTTTRKIEPFADILRLYNIIDKNDKYTLLQNPITKARLELWVLNIPDKEQLKLVDTQIISQKSLNCLGYLQIVSHKVAECPEFCSTFYQIHLLAENPIQSLSEYLINRGQKDYTETELWHLLDCLTLAQSGEQKYFLNFENIYYAADDNWKIRSFEENASLIDIYNRNMLLQERDKFPHIYPSPEELLNHPQISKEKSTVFSLGMLLLHIGLAQSCDSIYQQNKIDENKISLKIQEFSKQYSEQLSGIIAGMLQIDHFARFDYFEIRKKLKAANKSKISEQSNLLLNLPKIQIIQNNSNLISSYKSPQFMTPSQQMFYPEQVQSAANPLNNIRFQSSLTNLQQQQAQQQVSQQPYQSQQPQQSQYNQYNFSNQQNQQQHLSFPQTQFQTQPQGQDQSHLFPSFSGVFGQTNFRISQVPEVGSHLIASDNRQKNQNGEGKLQFSDGGYYEGEITNNKMHGKGKLYYDNGKLAYEGEFENGRMNNFGFQYNRNPTPLEGSFDYSDFTQIDNYWDRYEGDIKLDMRDGIGQLFLSNDEYYMGSFCKNQINGHGTFKKLNGETIHGYFEKDKLIKLA